MHDPVRGAFHAAQIHLRYIVAQAVQQRGGQRDVARAPQHQGGKVDFEHLARKAHARSGRVVVRRAGPGRAQG